MNHTDGAIIAGLALGHLRRDQEAQTREQAYHGYVHSFMVQGYDIDTAHRMTQDWFAQQNAAQARIAAVQARHRRKVIFWALVIFVVVMCVWGSTLP